MPHNAEGGAEPDALVDTSVAVALLVSDHEHHQVTMGSLRGRHLGLAGHAAFETFSVLTRLPPPLRRTPSAAHQLISSNFSETLFLGEAPAGQLLWRLATLGIAGGAVYDALVGATAVAYGIRLVTRDRRAIDTYRALQVDLEILD
ncbi:MAG: VapC toxin family PIN domain ribonuclease [Acidimicrobiales bacterium]|nr:MAG: VapC toxin family PIN domain ribonuclease [Acidimicrobiales bacterium]